MLWQFTCPRHRLGFTGNVARVWQHMHLLPFVVNNGGLIDGIEADKALYRKFSQPNKVISAVWSTREFISGMCTDRHTPTTRAHTPLAALSTGRPPTGVGYKEWRG